MTTSESLAPLDVDVSIRRAPRKKKNKGVFVALAEAGIRLAHVQRRAIERLCRAHPELLTVELSPEAAVERLIAHRIQFTGAQLQLIGDETTISGMQRVTSDVEATEISVKRHGTVNMRAPRVPEAPSQQELTRTVLDSPRVVRKRGWFDRLFGWLFRTRSTSPASS